MSWLRNLVHVHPLEDIEDLLARAAVRALWGIGPYFVLALVLSSLGYDRLIKSWVSVIPLAVLYLGVILDWLRLRSAGAAGPTPST